MRVVGHEKGEVLGLGYCKVWCFAGLCSGSLAVDNVRMYVCVYVCMYIYIYIYIYIYVYIGVINDTPKIINKLSHTIFFADDSSIVVISSNHIELNQKLNSNLHIFRNHLKKFSWYETQMKHSKSV